MTENAHGLVRIGKLVLTFAKVNRATFHEDGVRHESDTDHTVMVSVCAGALAQKLYPELNMGLVMQFASVHDLVEAYCGDVDSFGLSQTSRKQKEENERNALLKVKSEFHTLFPWISDTIEKYESLDTKEARFVKTVDKLMPKITHILNKGACFICKNLSEEHMWENYLNQTKSYEEKYGKEFPELLALNSELIRETKRITYEK